MGAVLGDRHARGPQRPGEAEQELVGLADRLGHLDAHGRSIWSSACCTFCASSRYFTSAPSVRAADSRSRSAVPRWCSARAQSRVSATPGGFCSPMSAQLLHDADHLPGQLLRHLGRAGPDDLDLAVEARVLDPVVEAAPLQRVVQLAGPVRGEHDDRRRRGRHGAELGDAHLVGREHLEQERLELVVGPVDLVDEQHRRALLQRGQHRPGQQEPLVVQALLGLLARRRGRRHRPPRGHAGAGSGAGSPSRRAPGWRRCPRSTAAAPAAGPARRPEPPPARSCRCRARPRAAAAAASAARGR